MDLKLPGLLKKALFVCLLGISVSGFGQELCNNGIDDDGDGLIDLNDSVDCVCGAQGTPTVVPSLIPNPSFEVINYCPTSYSQLDGAAGWIQATTDATSDYFNTCGFVFPATTAAGLLPFPDGNGAAGAIFTQDYKEYIGACLLSPMTPGTSYQVNFNMASTLIDGTGGVCPTGTPNPYGPVDLTIFGAPNCSSLPVAGTMDCPSSVDPNWIVLGSVSYTPSVSWGIVSISFTPTTTINTIMIGAPCNLPTYPSEFAVSCYPYFYFDNLTLNNAGAFGLVSVSGTGSYCTGNIVLTATINGTVTSGASLQWYHDGVAIVGATGNIYNVPAGTGSTGTYQVKLTDGTSCAKSNIYTVSSTPPVLSVSSVSICPSMSATLAANNYSTYAWSTGASTSSITVFPSTTTVYTVTGTLGTCTAQATPTVTVFSTSLAITGNTLVCAGQSTTLTAASASTYAWSESGAGGTLNVYSGPVVTATPFTTTSYTVNGSSGAGMSFCTGQAVITVSVSPSPTISISPANSFICKGDAAVLSASVTGASTQTWSTGATTPTITVSPANTTTYTAMTSVGSCSVQALATVNVNPPPNIQVSSSAACYGQPVTLSASGAATYTWSNGATTSVQTVTPGANATYTVTGTGSSGCTASVVATVSVAHPVAGFTGANGDVYSLNEVLNLVNTSTGASQYQWNICGTVFTSTNVSIPLSDTGYCCVTLYAFEGGCVDSTDHCFHVISDAALLIPNVFTPNGDNSNEVFKISGTGISSLHCSIFNRWGLKVYEWDGLSGGWNGQIKSTPASTGTYFYVVEYTNLEGKSKTEKGFLSLFRD